MLHFFNSLYSYSMLFNIEKPPICFFSVGRFVVNVNVEGYYYTANFTGTTPFIQLFPQPTVMSLLF